MPRFNVHQPSFNGGEFGPHGLGRSEIPRFAFATQYLRNFLCVPAGPLLRRSGTRFVAEQKDSTKKARLQRFQFNTQQTVMQLWEEGSVRFFEDEAPVWVASRFVSSGNTNTSVDDFRHQIKGEDANHYFVHNQGPMRFFNTTDTYPTPFDEDTDYYIKLPQEAVVDSIAADEITFTADHGYTSGQGPFLFRTTGYFSDSGIDTNTEYYVNVTGSDTVTLHVDRADGISGASVLSIGSIGGGTATCYPKPEYQRQYFQLATAVDGDAINITSTGTGTHSIGGKSEKTLDDDDRIPAQATIPHLEADLPEMQFAQSADVLYAATLGNNLRQRPGKMQRFGTSNWLYDPIDFQDGPYFPEVPPSVATLEASATTGNDASGARITLTASTDVFASGDVGRLVRIKDSGGQWGHCEIREVMSATKVRVNILSALPASGSPAEGFRLGAWGQSTATGYPGVVNLFEQRLAWANHSGGPHSFYASRSALDFEDMAPTDADGLIGDSDSLTYSLYDNQVNAIQWMRTMRSLLIGTTDNVWPMQATTFLDPIVPGNIQSRVSESAGAARIVPVGVNNRIVYAARSKRKLSAASYDFRSDSYHGEYVDYLADQAFSASSIRWLDYAEFPHSIIWVGREDGLLYGITYMPNQQIEAFHGHAIGGPSGVAGVVEWGSTLPSQDESYSQLWILVKRTIDGQVKRYVEFMEEDYDANDTTTTGFFVDAGATWTGSASSTATGFSHLANETVDVVANGVYQGEKTVTAGGDITGLPDTSTTVVAGFGYTSEMETLRRVAVAQTDSTENRRAKASSVAPRFTRTVAGEASQVGSSWVRIPHEDPTFDAAPPQLDDVAVRTELSGDWTREVRVAIRQTRPYPMALVSLSTEIEVAGA